MTTSDWVAGAPLALGVLAELICCIGLLVMDDVFDRLHYLSASSTVGAALIVAAVAVRGGLTSTSVKAGLVLLVMLATGPVLTHAIARAAWLAQGADERPSRRTSRRAEG